MDFMDLIRARQSVRKYKDAPVERDKLESLAEAVRLAPSATNTQPWRLVVVDDPELKAEVAAATFNPLVAFNKFVPGAPVIAVIVVEPQDALHRTGAFVSGLEYPLIDIGIAAEHLCLRAAELGLGTCMIGWFDGKRIKKLLGVPRDRKIGLLVTIGYPADERREKKRKPLESMLSYNRYGGEE